MTAALRERQARAVLAPDAITGLVLWLKADALVLSDNDAVATWADASGTGNDLTQGTGAAQPLYKVAILNGKPVVRFDGTDDVLFRTSAVVSSGDLSVAMVVKFGAITTGVTMVGIRRSSAANPIYGQHRISGSRLVADWRNDAGSLISPSPTPTLTTTNAYVLSQVLSGTALTCWLNGALLATATAAGGALTVDRTGVGAAVANTTTGFLNGDIAEVCVYNAALTVSQHQQLVRGLGAKWAVGVA